MTENDPNQPTDATPTPGTPGTPEAPVTPEAPTAETPAAPVTPPVPTVETPAAPVIETPPVPVPTRAPRRPTSGNWWWGVGRRKSAVARVRVRAGEGKIVVNKKPFDQYFNEERDRNDLVNVLDKTKTKSTVDVHVNVRGGGFTGQAGAIILGMGRALMEFDPSLEPILRDNNFLTRDPRKVERKKYGQPGARKRFQFSKR